MEEIDIVSIYKKVLDGKLKRFPPETWNPYKSGFDTAHRLFHYVVTEKLKWGREEFCKNINLQLIRKHKLNGGLQGLYNNNIFPYISKSFPEWNIEPWELWKSRVPKDFWTEESTKRAIKWMIEKKLKWTYEDILENLSTTTFKNNNLEGMLQSEFEHSPYLATKHAYPEKDWSIMYEKKGYSLTLSEANKIRNIIREEKITQKEIANRLKVSTATISMVMNDKVWKPNK
jgi:hypothetical protein